VKFCTHRRRAAQATQLLPAGDTAGSPKRSHVYPTFRQKPDIMIIIMVSYPAGGPVTRLPRSYPQSSVTEPRVPEFRARTLIAAAGIAGPTHGPCTRSTPIARICCISASVSIPSIVTGIPR